MTELVAAVATLGPGALVVAGLIVVWFIAKQTGFRFGNGNGNGKKVSAAGEVPVEVWEAKMAGIFAAGFTQNVLPVLVELKNIQKDLAVGQNRILTGQSIILDRLDRGNKSAEII